MKKKEKRNRMLIKVDFNTYNNLTLDEKKSILTPEEKYEIAQSESDALKKNIEEGRIKSDSILETLRAILEETDMAITEIRKVILEINFKNMLGCFRLLKRNFDWRRKFKDWKN